MINIDKYVEQLKSPDRLERYDACDKLRDAYSLPDKAVLALQEATNDPSTLVADAAWRALAAHKISNRSSQSKEQVALDKGNQRFGWGIAEAIYGFLRRKPALSIGLILLTSTAVALVVVQLVFDSYRTRGWINYTNENSPVLGYGTNTKVLFVDTLNRVWVGSEEELLMLSPDGKWTNYTTANSGCLLKYIKSLDMDGKKQMWVGSYGGGLCLFAPDGTWKSYTVGNSDQYSNNVRSLTVDNQDRVWVATTNGLTLITPDGSWSNIEGAPTDIKMITVDNQGQVWVGTDTSVMVMGTDGIWKKYDLASSGLIPEIDYYDGYDTKLLALAVDSQERAWVGTGIGLARVDLNGNWEIFINSNPALASNWIDFVDAVVVDSKDQIWVGIREVGLNMLSPDGKWTTYASNKSSLAESGIAALAVDAKGQIWVRSTEGLSVLDPDKTVPHQTVDGLSTLRMVLIIIQIGEILYLLPLVLNALGKTQKSQLHSFVAPAIPPTERQSLQTEQNEAPETEQYVAPAKRNQWFGWGKAGAISGNLVGLVVLILWTNIFNDNFSTGGAEFGFLGLGLFCLVSVFGGPVFGLIGGYFARIIMRRNNYRSDLPLIFALLAGAIPVVVYGIWILNL